MQVQTPYGLDIIESCLGCPLRQDRFLCDLPKETLARWDALSTAMAFPQGAVLFVEGQRPRGIFTICSGRVKLTANSARGKAVILRIAEAGEVVGLPGTISGLPYEVTAEALEPLQINFIGREPFLDFLAQNGDACLKVAAMLTSIYHATYREVRYLALSGSVAQRLALYLVDLSAQNPADPGGRVRVRLTLGHAEIAEILGMSRETVTRTLTVFKKEHLIEARGATLIVIDPARLKALAESGPEVGDRRYALK